MLLGLFIINPIVNLCCNNQEKINDDGILNQNIRKFSFDKAQLFLTQNRNTLDSLAKNAFIDSSITRISRRDKNTNLLSPEYNINSNVINYTLNCKNGNFYYFNTNSLSDLKEDNTEIEYSSIKDEDNLSLSNIIKVNNINPFSLRYLLQFINKYNALSITKHNEFLKINFSVTQGIFYIKQTDMVWQNIESTTEVEKLDNNWFYFKEVW